MVDADSSLLDFLSKVMVLRCLVLGLILGIFAISIAPALSSVTLQCLLGVAFNAGIVVLLTLLLLRY